MKDTVWGTKANRYLVPDPSSSNIVVPCGKQSIPLATWQRTYAQDQGATVAKMPPTMELMDQARALLGL